MLGYSPLEQPEQLFTWQDYKAFVRETRKAWWETIRAYRSHRPGWASQDISLYSGKKGILQDLLAQYLTQLPLYLLARCPICGGQVSEPIDTFSLNGPGWNGPRMEPSGRGWLGDKNFGGSMLSPAITYQSECDHTQLLFYGVNLKNRHYFYEPTWTSIFIGSEKPFVIAPLLKLDDTYAVLHRLPLGYFADEKLTTRCEIYVSTYFTKHPEAFQEVLAAYESPFRQGPRRISPYGGADYDLLPWVAQGRLYWLDETSPALELKTEDTSAFPYSDVSGRRGRWVLTKHKLNAHQLRALTSFQRHQ